MSDIKVFLEGNDRGGSTIEVTSCKRKFTIKTTRVCIIFVLCGLEDEIFFGFRFDEANSHAELTRKLDVFIETWKQVITQRLPSNLSVKDKRIIEIATEQILSAAKKLR